MIKRRIIMPKVVVMGGVSESYKRIFGERGIEVDFCSSKDEDEIAAVAKDADAILFTSTKFTNSLFDKLPKLKIISRSGIGIDTVDMDAASAHGVIVCNSASYGTYDVAEHTVALMLSLVHSIPRYNHKVKSANDWGCADIPPAHRLSDRVLGVVGFGKISRWICTMMKGFGMETLVYDPYINLDVARELGVKSVTLDELIEMADIISVNAPLTKDTHHLINAERIARMKDDVLIVNTSRGPLIDEEALIAALESGKVAGAALDVFENEPFENESKFRTLDNVIITPHVAWRSHEAMRDLKLEVTGNIIDYFEGKPLKNQLNLK